MSTNSSVHEHARDFQTQNFVPMKLNNCAVFSMGLVGTESL